MSGTGFRSWMAGVREWRAALLISLLCIALITVAVIRPELFTWHTTETATAPQSHFQVPVKPIPSTQQHALQQKRPMPTAKPAAVTPKPQPTPNRAGKSTAKPPVKQATPPPAPTPAAAKQPLPTGYYIQLAAFRKRALAERLADRLRHIRIRTRIVEKNGIHAVWAGPWATRGEADAEKVRLDKRTRLKGYVIRQ